jgi:hypothetical protein
MSAEGSTAHLDLGGEGGMRAASASAAAPAPDLVARAQAFGVDGCAGVRRVYARFFALMTANSVVCCGLMGIPTVYLFGFAVAMSEATLANAEFTAQFALGAWVLCFIFVACWVLSVLCVVFAMPNVIAVPLVIMRMLSHWALISFLLLLFYGSTLGPLLGVLAGLIVFMLFSADVMRAEQEKLFAAIASTQRAAAEALEYRDAAIKARAAGAAAPGAATGHPLEAMSTEEHA